MKLSSNLKKFLIDTVNLNKTRFDTASSGIDTVTSFLKSDAVLKELFVDISTQGSFRQKTIIKPASEDLEFDVDLLFEMKIVNSWEPKDYLKNVAARFSLSERYKHKVDTKGKSRCVTLDYERDFHIDLVPAVRSGDALFVMNKNTNEYESTDGDGYAEWFGKKNVLAGGFLVEAVRLIKYVRDIRQTFIVRSILLTTLLGNQVIEGDDDNIYSDLPTTLKTLINRLDNYLQMNSSMPEIVNPILPTESFNRHWNQEKYEDFREKINALNERVNEAYVEGDKDESIKKWRLVFGDYFPNLGEVGKATTIAIVRDIGEEFLSDTEYQIPTNLVYTIKINAKVEQNGFRPFNLIGALWPLKKQRSLEFFIQSHSIPEPFDLKWKVKNYGDEAIRAGDRRGKIIGDNGSRTRSETTKYHGSHYVECYAIKNGVCVATDKIDVPIGSL